MMSDNRGKGLNLTKWRPCVFLFFCFIITAGLFAVKHLFRASQLVIVHAGQYWTHWRSKCVTKSAA